MRQMQKHRFPSREAVERDARRRTATGLPWVAALFLAATGAQASDGWKAGGDMRTGYLSSETRSRSGETSSSDSARMRLRVNLKGELGNGWRFGGRVAARLDTRQDDEKFWLRPYAPSPAGLNDGQATVDELYVDYRVSDSPWSLRLGRFQAAFGLADVMKKSLDQSDSPSFDITWTDGAWLQHRSKDWTTHLIVRHNDRRGPSGTLRRPLDFVDDGTRASVFVALESTTPAGPLVQRMVTLTWLPSALRPYGIGDARKQDYLSVTTKATAQWPLGGSGMKFRLGGELGYAPNVPRREVMKSGIGRADSLSWQTSFNFIDILPNHNLGIVYGRAADGWLVSSDFRPNDASLEARWVWRVNSAWAIDARVRRRVEIDLPDNASRSRRDNDLYVRATVRF